MINNYVLKVSFKFKVYSNLVDWLIVMSNNIINIVKSYFMMYGGYFMNYNYIFMVSYINMI